MEPEKPVKKLSKAKSELQLMDYEEINPYQIKGKAIKKAHSKANNSKFPEPTYSSILEEEEVNR